MFCHIFHNNIFFFLFFSRQDGCENRNGTFSVRVESVPCCDEALTCSRAIILDLQVAGPLPFFFTETQIFCPRLYDLSSLSQLYSYYSLSYSPFSSSHCFTYYISHIFHLIICNILRSFRPQWKIPTSYWLDFIADKWSWTSWVWYLFRQWQKNLIPVLSFIGRSHPHIERYECDQTEPCRLDSSGRSTLLHTHCGTVHHNLST